MKIPRLPNEEKKAPWYEKKTGGERRVMNARRPPRPHTPYTLQKLSIGEARKVRQ